MRADWVQRSAFGLTEGREGEFSNPGAISCESINGLPIGFVPGVNFPHSPRV